MVIALIAAKLAGMLSETLKEKFLLAAFNIGEYGIAAIVIVAAVIVTIASWFWSQRILEKRVLNQRFDLSVKKLEEKTSTICFLLTKLLLQVTIVTQ